MAIPGNFLSQVTETVDPNTSGWVAMLNATILLGTGGRSGDGTLNVRSVASGEMRARTVTAYPIIAGTVYHAFADAQGATVPERIGIRWLNALNVEISITWSLTTAAASGTWHRIAVAGPAPVGAVRAQVVVSASPVAGAVINQFENFYLGLPMRTLGNLLEFNTESSEIDGSAWTVDANCSVARQLPPVQWSIGNYLAGGHAMGLTVTANGNASMKTAAPVSAQPGVEYVAYAYINPPTGAANCWIEIRFTDAGGSVLGTQRSPLAAPSTSWYRQIASGIAPAGTTGVVLAAGITAGTAAQLVRIDTVVVADVAASGVAVAGLPPDTVLPFADANIEQGVGTWTVISGVATIARSTPWGSTAFNNGYSMKVTSSTATTSVLRTGRFPVVPVPSSSWAAVCDFNVAIGGWTCVPDILWYDATNTLITGPPPSTPIPLPGAGWWWVREDRTAPTGAVSAALQITVTAPGAAAVGYLDKMIVHPAMPQFEFAVIDASASIRVTIRELIAGDTLTLWRVTPDGTRTLVRGPDGLLAGYVLSAETLVIEDYEAPLGVEVSYYVEIRKPDGSLRRAAGTQGVGFLEFADVNWCWLKDPGNPERNMLLMVESGPEWSYPIDQAAYVVKKRTNKVTLSGQRNGGEGGNLVVWTCSDQERISLKRLLSSGAILLWQTAPTVGEGNVYVSVGDVPAARGNQIATDAWRTWTLPLTESDMPVTTGVSGSAGRTWQDVLTEFDTWQDVYDAFATWEDVYLNRRRA